MNSIQKCKFLVVIIILKEVLRCKHINVLRNTLQNRTSTLGAPKNVIIVVIVTFRTIRSDNEFLNL